MLGSQGASRLLRQEVAPCMPIDKWASKQRVPWTPNPRLVDSLGGDKPFRVGHGAELASKPGCRGGSTAKSRGPCMTKEDKCPKDRNFHFLIFRSVVYTPA